MQVLFVHTPDSEHDPVQRSEVTRERAIWAAQLARIRQIRRQRLVLRMGLMRLRRVRRRLSKAKHGHPSLLSHPV